MDINYKELIGFTCKEFIIAIVFVAVLSLVAYPSYDSAVKKNETASVAGSSVSHYQLKNTNV